MIERISIPDDVTEIALCGGPYNNFSALEEFLKRTDKSSFRFCLGDLGGFGPYPDRTIHMIRASNMRCIQGNYDESVGRGGEECGCGYIDPRDRHFAQLSFDYTLKNTSVENRAWLSSLPKQILLEWGGQKILLCHGSPREVNEFVWESETTDEKIQSWLKEYGVNGFCATHSGLPWIRNISDKGFWFNVGVLGRPAHEGKPHVYYGTLNLVSGRIDPQLHMLAYDPTDVVQGMRDEGLPEEFCESLTAGIWTTCCNIMPPAEREVRPRLRKA